MHRINNTSSNSILFYGTKLLRQRAPRRARVAGRILAVLPSVCFLIKAREYLTGLLVVLKYQTFQSSESRVVNFEFAGILSWCVGGAAAAYGHLLSPFMIRRDGFQERSHPLDHIAIDMLAHNEDSVFGCQGAAVHNLGRRGSGDLGGQMRLFLCGAPRSDRIKFFRIETGAHQGVDLFAQGMLSEESALSFEILGCDTISVEGVVQSQYVSQISKTDSHYETETHIHPKVRHVASEKEVAIHGASKALSISDDHHLVQSAAHGPIVTLHSHIVPIHVVVHKGRIKYGLWNVHETRVFVNDGP